MQKFRFPASLKQWSLSLFLFVIIGSLSPSAVCFGSCEYLSEDFSSGGSRWTPTAHATWSFPSGTLDVQAVESGKLARADVAFFPSDMFSVDADINILNTSSDNDAVGIYFWTKADVLFSVAGHTTDGVAALYYPASNHVQFLIWDVSAGEWVSPPEWYSVPMAVDSIGLSMTSGGVVLRLNGQDTNMEIAGDFSFGPVVIDTLSLLAKGTGLHARFDNVCGSMYEVSDFQPGNAMLMPNSMDLMPVKPAAAAPVVSIDPAQAIPLGFGSAANGGGIFSLSAGISGLAAPADLYIALQSNVFGPEIYLFGQDNSLHAYSSDGLVKWRSSSTGGIQAQILTGIPLSVIPAGTYNFYFLIAPAGGDLNAYRLWMSQLTVAGGSGTGTQMEQDIRQNIDLILGLTSGASGGLTEITQLFSDTNVVTTSPSNLDLNSLLSGTPITITANFGAGYQTQAGSVFTGSAQIVLSNIVFGSQGLGGSLSATFNNITKDGAPFINGHLSGNVSLTQNATQHGDISGQIVFDNLQVSGMQQSGTIQLSGTMDKLDLSSLSSLSGQLRLTFANYVSGGHSISSGTVDISANPSSSTHVVTNLQTSEGPVNLNLSITTSPSGSTIINTSSPGAGGQYTVAMNNVTLDNNICAKYPVSGTISFMKNGITGVVTFTGACDGSYGYSEQ